MYSVQLKDKAAVTAFVPGQQLNVTDMFKEGDFVDVAGITIGKGFQGETASRYSRFMTSWHDYCFCAHAMQFKPQ